GVEIRDRIRISSKRNGGPRIMVDDVRILCHGLPMSLTRLHLAAGNGQDFAYFVGGGHDVRENDIITASVKFKRDMPANEAATAKDDMHAQRYTCRRWLAA